MNTLEWNTILEQKLRRIELHDNIRNRRKHITTWKRSKDRGKPNWITWQHEKQTNPMTTTEIRYKQKEATFDFQGFWYLQLTMNRLNLNLKFCQDFLFQNLTKNLKVGATEGQSRGLIVLPCPSVATTAKNKNKFWKKLKRKNNIRYQGY